jgi:hypothetical protein
MNFGEIAAFAGPLIGEAVGLIGKYIASRGEERAAIVARKDAAIAEMKAARITEREAHEARTDETRKIIRDELAKQAPNPTVLTTDEPTRP